MKFPFVFVASLLFLSTLSVLGGSSKKKESIQEISRDAYVWGYPVVFLSHIRESMLAKTKESKNSLNHFFNSRKIPDSFLGSFLSVNPENVYSWAWVDLSKEPLVLIHPQIKDRFYSIQFVDAYANVFRTLSNHNQGEKPGAFLITPPGWHGPLPAAMGQILASTPEIFIFSQTFLEGFNGRTSFSKLEFKPKLIPLSQWMAGVEIDSFRAEYPQARLKIDKNLATGGRKFYQELSRIVAKNPPPQKQKPKRWNGLTPLVCKAKKTSTSSFQTPKL
ncbi:MAG: DUF1254 domain-containing protein [Pseudobdellovibrionaceae bacterium]